MWEETISGLHKRIRYNIKYEFFLIIHAP
jgi:hypothetical protein